jgi:hypothetical protein
VITTLATTTAMLPSDPALETVAEQRRRVLLWHWGRAGAGSKLTYELVRELQNLPGIEPTVSASEGSELAMLAGSDKDITLRTVRTFYGNKTSWAGKLQAAFALLRLRQISTRFSLSVKRTADRCRNLHVPIHLGSCGYTYLA